MKTLCFALFLLLTATQTLTAQHSIRRNHKPKLFRSVDVEYWNTTDSIILGGTLTIPNQRGKRFPAVILISGSGQQDRDCTSWIYFKPFREIAEYLSSRGIAVLRVDDRGAGKTGFKGPGYVSSRIRASTNPLLTDLVRDVKYGIKYLKTENNIDSSKIGLLGHSLGGVIAPAVATETSVAFIVSLAGPVLLGRQVDIQRIHDELEADGLDTLSIQIFIKNAHVPIINLLLSNPTEEEVKKACPNIVKNIRDKVDSTTLIKAGLGNITDNGLITIISREVMDNSVREILTINPLLYWRKVTSPSLIVFMAKDLQVNALTNSSKMLEELNNKNKLSYQISILSHLNHAMRVAKYGSMNENKLLNEGVSPALLEIVNTWLKNCLYSKKATRIGRI